MKAMSLKLMAVALLATSLSTTGCTLVNPGKPIVHQGPAGPTATVVFLKKGKKPEEVQLALNGPTYVGQALDQTNARKRFKNMDVQLTRKTANGRPLRMGVKYNVKAKRVEADSDYAIHPGDRLVVTDASKPLVDHMLGGGFLPPRKK